MLGRLTKRHFSGLGGHSLSPLDGRYKAKISPLLEYFSEAAFFKYRIVAEVEWLKHLARKAIMPLRSESSLEAFGASLDRIYEDGDFYAKIKEIEQVTNHDIKAVEYYIKNYMSARQDLQSYTEYVHFTCTSEDINNIAYALMLSSARRDTLQPEFGALYDTLALMADKYKATRMMGRTHGQSATPTTMGKEIANYAYRLNLISNEANKVRFGAKLNGAVGNYNAHQVVYPEFDWIQISREFIESLGLQWTPYSTQIENHDSMCQYFAHQKHLNTVLIGLSRDFWHYISLGYFKQKTVKGEIGSSTMPHKVNPIDFENAEGNFGVANALFGHFTDKLPISRYQRDLSDSTVLRNMGLAFGYTSLSYSSLLKGLKKIDVQEKVLIDELDSHWELLAEPIQMMMRKCGVENPYEKIKEVTRGAVVTEKTIKDFVNALDIDPKIKSGLLSLRPSNYIGYAEKLAGDLKKYTDERH